LKELGGTYLQLTNSARPKDGSKPGTDLLLRYASVLNEIGRAAMSMGIQAVYHNHMGQLGETPEEVDTIMSGCDPDLVKLLLDVGHYTQGGGDPAACIHKYKDRIAALHLKDVKSNPAMSGYKFVELGQGRVDFPGIFKALDEIKFKGWAMVELDAVPEPGRTPLQSATISKEYLTKNLKGSF
jgi:inosose dehydratase